MPVGSYLHTTVPTTLPGTGIITGRMAIVGLPVSAIKDVPRVEVHILPSNMESLIPRFTRAHGLRGGHIGIGTRMFSGGT